jgi:hypothetical protein
VSCAASATVDQVEQTLSAGNSNLTYDAITGHCTYVWKTEKSWAGSCRRLSLKFSNEQEKAAEFKLSR